MAKGEKNGNIHPTRIFKRPEDLYRAFEQYKEDLRRQSKEWIKVYFAGKEGTRRDVELKVPKTMEGFKTFCYEPYGCIVQYFKNQDGLYKDFIPVCLRIKNEIREDQVVGGLLNVYNPSITQRLNGMTDKKEVKADVTTFYVGGEEEEE